MRDFITYFFKGSYLLFTDNKYRVLVKLFVLNIFKRRYTPYTVSVNGYKLSIVDFKSFVYQYQEIFFNKFYEFKTDSKHPVIYDCGSNIGTSVLFFSQKYPEAKIVAFEPSPYVFGVLKKNIEKNNIKNAELHQNAVWTKNELIEFNDEGADSGSIYAVSSTKKIQVQALDFLEVINKESKIDLLKIDIEGAEMDLLPHIAPVLDRVENIFIEYHSFNNQEQKLDQILLLLRQHHFRFYIRHGNDRKKPFINTKADKDMDMQLNIFAYKI